MTTGRAHRPVPSTGRARASVTPADGLTGAGAATGEGYTSFLRQAGCDDRTIRFRAIGDLSPGKFLAQVESSYFGWNSQHSYHLDGKDRSCEPRTAVRLRLTACAVAARQHDALANGGQEPTVLPDLPPVRSARHRNRTTDPSAAGSYLKNVVSPIALVSASNLDGGTPTLVGATERGQQRVWAEYASTIGAAASSRSHPARGADPWLLAREKGAGGLGITSNR
jgi:hypothetical protein